MTEANGILMNAAISTAFGLLLATAPVTGALQAQEEEAGTPVHTPSEDVAAGEDQAAAAPAWFFDLAGGFQSSTHRSPGPLEFDHPLFGPEPGVVDARYGRSDSALFEATLGYRVQNRLAIAVTISRSSHDLATDIAAELPHPFFFERPRTAEGKASVPRSELALHLSLMWRIREGGKLDFTLLVGPSWFDFEQGMARDVEFESEYPYDTASFTRLKPEVYSTAATGYHVGAETAYWFRPRTGLLAMVRWSEGPTEFKLDRAGQRVTAEAGGLQTTVGIRFRF